VPPPQSNTTIFWSLCFLVQAVGQRGRRGLVDDAAHLQAGDLTGFLGGLALRIVEVGRHGDHRFAHRGAEVIFGGLLHLLQDHRADLLRGVLAVAHLHAGHAVVATHHLVGYACDLLGVLFIGVAHEALDGVNGVPGVGDGLALGRVAHLALAVLHEGHDAGGGALAFAVGDHHRFVAFHHGHAAVGGSQVDPDDLAHVFNVVGGKFRRMVAQSLRRSGFLGMWPRPSTFVPAVHGSSLGRKTADPFP
jgi:hypothetical protein